MSAKPIKKKAKAKPAVASERGVSMAQLRASVNRVTAALERLITQDAEREARMEARDAEFRKAQEISQGTRRQAGRRRRRISQGTGQTRRRVSQGTGRVSQGTGQKRRRNAKRAAEDAEFRKEQAKRDAELDAKRAAEDAEFRKEQAKRDAERDAWMKRLGESDEKTRKRIEAAERARGRAAEAQFRKALPGLLAKKGMPVDHVEPRALRKKDREYDFFARNGNMNFVGEIKVRFQAKDLAQLRSALAKFREDYPDKAGDRPIYGVVCGMTVEEDAANIARDEGFLVAEGRTDAKLRLPPQIRDH